MLKFSPANAKTKRLIKVPALKRYFAGHNKVYSFDLPAGWSCPFARDCQAKVYVENGRRWLEDGPHAKFRCFSASQEIAFPNVWDARQHNFNRLRGLHLNDMIRRIDRSIPYDMGICRLHVSGDFFSSDYMFAWINMAMKYRYILFYAYTKSLRYWLKWKDYIDVLPNFILTASYGGAEDNLIRPNRLRYSKVVNSKWQARKLHLPIDHNDSHAATNGGSFALLIHGPQKAGSLEGKAVRKLRGAGSYSR